MFRKDFKEQIINDMKVKVYERQWLGTPMGFDVFIDDMYYKTTAMTYGEALDEAMLKHHNYIKN